MWNIMMDVIVNDFSAYHKMVQVIIHDYYCDDLIVYEQSWVCCYYYVVD